MFISGDPIDRIAYFLGRTEGAIYGKLEELGLAIDPNRPSWSRPFPSQPLYYSLDWKGPNKARHIKQKKENLAANRPSRVGFIWSDEEDTILRRELNRNMSVQDMALQHKRLPNGIHSRLKVVSPSMA